MTHRRTRTARAREPLGPDGAMEVAARFLATRPRTRWEVERRLRRAGVEDELVATTLERLGQLGFLDDAAFAAWWADQRDRHAPRGRRMIEAELRQRGVGRETIEGFREAHAAPERAPEDEARPSTEPERAAAALAAHLRGRSLPTDPKALQRLGMFLVRRGFDPQTARAAIRAAAPGNDETDLS